METTTKHRRPRRHQRRGNGTQQSRGVPYLMRLPDARNLFLEIPRQFVEKDRAGEVVLTPPGVAWLDRVRALALTVASRPTPGHIHSLRRALRLTQQDLADRIGVDKLTVSRWERGVLRPRAKSCRALERMRRQATRRGVRIED